MEKEFSILSRHLELRKQRDKTQSAAQGARWFLILAAHPPSHS